MQRMLQPSPIQQSASAISLPTSSACHDGRWLLLIYHLASQPSSARSAIWREMKRLGALSLQHGVCLLPRTAASQAAYARLARRVEEYGGATSVLETISPDAAWQERTVLHCNAARDDEYAEVVEETERFQAEIDRERGQGTFTCAEWEGKESTLERLGKYLGQVLARDAFGAPGQAGALAAVARCAEVLEALAQEIFARQPVAMAAAGRREDEASLHALR